MLFMTFFTIAWVPGILSSSKLVLEGNAGWVLLVLSRLELFKKFQHTTLSYPCKK